MGELQNIHNKLRRCYLNQIEPFEVWEHADAHRMHWKPDKVKTILLAESHVFTTAEEAQRKVNLSALPDAKLYEKVPKGFVRLVYCLGYGENELLDFPISDPLNAGTWQFWKIFYSCLHRVASNNDFAPILVGGTPNLNARIQNKLALLQGLKDQGVWLLDASLAALYPSPVENIYDDCISESWSYVCEKIGEVQPGQIIVVGMGVGHAMRERVEMLNVPFDLLYQPQARLSAEDHLSNFQRFYDLIHNCGDDEGQSPMEKVRPRVPIVPSSVSGESLVKQNPSPRWTLNGRHGYYSRRIRLDESPIILNLWFKEKGEPNATEIGLFPLDLHELLEGGYIRYDPIDSKGPNVRVRIVRGEGGLFYIQVRKGSPQYMLEPVE